MAHADNCECNTCYSRTFADKKKTKPKTKKPKKKGY